MFSFFRRKTYGNEPKADAAPQPLRIEGIPEAPFTPEPDDAELAAQAVLELMTRGGQSNRNTPSNQSTPNTQNNPTAQTTAYYRALASRIREAHAKAARQATRFIYNCELELQKPRLPLYGSGSVQMLETELYKRIDIIEREGGELKLRWQHCLAEVTVRLMNSEPPTSENEVTQEAQKTRKGFAKHG